MDRNTYTTAHSLYQIIERMRIERNHINAANNTCAMNMKIEFEVPTESGMPVSKLIVLDDQQCTNNIIAELFETINRQFEKLEEQFEAL